MKRLQVMGALGVGMLLAWTPIAAEEHTEEQVEEQAPAEDVESPPAEVLEPAPSDDFRPTEQLRADQEVDFPVDI